MPGNCNVLIVDDDPISRNFMEVILRKAGISFASVASGEEAVSSVQALRPLVILMDVVMPGMDGFEACRILKTDDHTSKIPVIFVTGNQDSDSESRCFEAGGADFVTKPVVAATVLARIRTQIAVSSDRRRLEGMFRDVIEYAPVAFLLTNLSGRLVTTNALALEHFGVARTDMLDSPLERWIPEIATRINWGMASVHADHFEMDCRRGDGSTFPAEITVGNLRTTSQPLDLFIVRNIDFKRRTLKELNDTHTRLRELGAQNESAREDERKRIAREVHDELGQVMTALRMDLSMLEMLYGAQVPQLKDKVGTMKELVDRAIGGVRQIASNLRPPALDMGLGAAVEWLVVEFNRNNTARVVLNLQGLQNRLQENRAMTLYRIIQESLNNIAKYAKASQVEISLRYNAGSLDLDVRDNGIGFDRELVKDKRSFGLLGMYERALSIGGELVVDSEVGRGTHIHARFPAAQWEQPSP